MNNQIDNEKILFKEIDVIQNIIKRMASNSFYIKGWTVTLIVVTLIFKGIPVMIFIAFIPLLVFWYLDAYFLRQERLYRKLYEWIIQNRMTTDEFLLDMNASRFDSKVQSIPRIMCSITILLFYGSIAALIILFGILLVLFPS